MEPYCPHETVTRQESRNPRTPMIVWRCVACGKMFAPKGHLRRWIVARREGRRLRRQLENWRNG